MSSLPDPLLLALDEEIDRFPYQALKQSAEELSQRYRQKIPGHQMRSEVDRLAYAVVRMPATYATACRVLKEVSRLFPNISFETLLDLGAGPGTIMWAAATVWQHLKQVTALEQDADLIELGKRLGQHSPCPALQTAQWKVQDITCLPHLEIHDVVVLSYVIGELPQHVLIPTLQNAWQAARHLLILIEPGTPHHFAQVIRARTFLIETGAHLVAPCPHALACPLATQGDWCHFSERVERSSLHRKHKGADLGYEDEKYSYIAVAKTPGTSTQARIVRQPQRHSGHVEFQLCTSEGIKQKTLSKRDGESYKKSRKLEWGDVF